MIRPATGADAAAIAAVHLAARRGAYAHLGTPEQVDGHVSVARWQQNLRGPHPTWVLERGGRVIGFSSLDGPMLIALYVHPDEQGRGAGAALLEHAVGEGARDLWVYEDNPGARTFYERRGWVVASEPVIEDEDWSLPVPALRYRLEP